MGDFSCVTNINQQYDVLLMSENYEFAEFNSKNTVMSWTVSGGLIGFHTDISWDAKNDAQCVCLKVGRLILAVGAPNFPDPFGAVSLPYTGRRGSNIQP